MKADGTDNDSNNDSNYYKKYDNVGSKYNYEDIYDSKITITIRNNNKGNDHKRNTVNN